MKMEYKITISTTTLTIQQLPGFLVFQTFHVMGVRQEVAMDSLKFQRAGLALLFYALWAGHP
jgi:hypothetical protein